MSADHSAVLLLVLSLLHTGVDHSTGAPAGALAYAVAGTASIVVE